MSVEKEFAAYRDIAGQAKKPGHGMTITRLWLDAGVLECYRKGNDETILLAAELDLGDRFVRVVRNDEALEIIRERHKRVARQP